MKSKFTRLLLSLSLLLTVGLSAADDALTLNDRSDGHSIPIGLTNSTGGSFAVNVSPTTATDFANKRSMNTIVGEAIVGERTDFVNVMFQYGIGTYDTITTISGDSVHTTSWWGNWWDRVG